MEELEALIAQETTKLSGVKKKAKLVALKQQLTELRKETLADSTSSNVPLVSANKRRDIRPRHQ